jgi:hypothetical protein
MCNYLLGVNLLPSVHPSKNTCINTVNIELVLKIRLSMYMTESSGSPVASEVLTWRHALYDDTHGLALYVSASYAWRQLRLGSSGQTLEISERKYCGPFLIINSNCNEQNSRDEIHHCLFFVGYLKFCIYPKYIRSDGKTTYECPKC